MNKSSSGGESLLTTFGIYCSTWCSSPSSSHLWNIHDAVGWFFLYICVVKSKEERLEKACLPPGTLSDLGAFLEVKIGDYQESKYFMQGRWSIKSCSSPGSSLHALMAWLKGWEHRLT
ncbi:hypothetical protein Y1Q_0001200 [Alligator mississippiensis]|uniref:Uncharacterized protein n=1 Tax=Alligator mississippiensis TaxID=8496 RepID=A0A151PEF9_ALLMI|nr:hypothetical protein Y1Q_0001200 [Alligator mississippiensis]